MSLSNWLTKLCKYNNISSFVSLSMTVTQFARGKWRYCHGKSVERTLPEVVIQLEMQTMIVYIAQHEHKQLDRGSVFRNFTV